MTEQFDPYRKWLGIPERDQPPHHYRLLGVEPFESDQEVIANAADARMAQIKTFQTGKHSDHSQRLLNELATAKVCLLNPTKKAEYDRKLEERVEGRGEINAATEDVPPALVVSAKPSAYLAHGRKKKQPAWLVPSVIAAVVVALIIVFVVSLQNVNDKRREPKRVDTARKERTPVQKTEPAPPVEKKPVVPPEAVPEPRETPPEKPDLPPVVAEPSEPEPAPEIVEPAAPEAPRKPVARGKPPAPDAAAQRESEAKIRELFSKEFAAADNAKRKSALAAKLRRQAFKKRNDPADRFVLHRLSAELSAESGDLARGFKTIDRLADRFEVDPLPMKVDLAEAKSPGYRVGVKTYNQYANLWINANTLLMLADDAVRKDDFLSASQAAKLAVQLARATKDAQFLRETATELREIDKLKSRFRPVEAAIGVLADNPGDAVANLTVGKWRCFAIGDWNSGLPLLAKGSDAGLADLARRDLAQPKMSEDQLALANDWLSAADREPQPFRTGVLSRACYLLELAAPSLPGMDKTTTEKQLAVLHKRGVKGEKVRGIVVKGNVALGKNGATVSGPKHGKRLLDGKTATEEKDYFAAEKWPCKWVFTLDRVYQLQEIRFKLYDADSRRFRYVLSVSPDGNRLTTVKDASQGGWTGWQQVRFSPQPVKAIVLEGLHSDKNEYFIVVELEGYCIPTKGMR